MIANNGLTHMLLLPLLSSYRRRREGALPDNLDLGGLETCPVYAPIPRTTHIRIRRESAFFCSLCLFACSAFRNHDASVFLASRRNFCVTFLSTPLLLPVCRALALRGQLT